jgi:hypothetical protein
MLPLPWRLALCHRKRNLTPSFVRLRRFPVARAVRCTTLRSVRVAGTCLKARIIVSPPRRASTRLTVVRSVRGLRTVVIFVKETPSSWMDDGNGPGVGRGIGGYPGRSFPDRSACPEEHIGKPVFILHAAASRSPFARRLTASGLGRSHALARSSEAARLRSLLKQGCPSAAQSSSSCVVSPIARRSTPLPTGQRYSLISR